MYLSIPVVVLFAGLGCQPAPPPPVVGGAGAPSADDGPALQLVDAELVGTPRICGGDLDGPRRFKDVTPWEPDRGDLSSGREDGMGAGVAVGDLDGDGHLDIYLPRNYGDEIWRGLGDGRFEDATVHWIPGEPMLAGEAAAMADIDGDGDLDVYVGRYGANSLLINDGSGRLSPAEEGSFDPGEHYTTAVSFADRDLDGDLDLHLGNYRYDGPALSGQTLLAGDPNLLQDNVDGAFVDNSELIAPQICQGYTYASAWVDVDGDVAPDLYLVNDFGPSYTPNQLLLNQGDAGLITAGDATGAGIAVFGMGLGVGDLNGDAVPEMAVSGWDGLYLLESVADATWARTESSRGLLPTRDGQHVAWGLTFGDLDNDARSDIYVPFGWLPFIHDQSEEISQLVGGENPYAQPDGVYRQTADGSFDEVGQAFDLDEGGYTRGVVLADFNEDGFLDVVRRDLQGRGSVHLNHCSDDAGWLMVRLHQPDSLNRRAVGARVEVIVEGVSQQRWMLAGGESVSSAGPSELHFGLGEAEMVDLIQVWWPDGSVSEIEGVASGQMVEITRRDG